MKFDILIQLKLLEYITLETYSIRIIEKLFGHAFLGPLGPGALVSSVVASMLPQGHLNSVVFLFEPSVVLAPRVRVYCPSG